MPQDTPPADRQTTVSFRPGDLAAELQQRGASFNQTARRDLARYYEALRWELEAVQLTAAEGAALVAFLGAWDAQPVALRYLAEALRQRVARDRVYREAHGAGATALTDRLREAPLMTAVALVDAAERVRAGSERTPVADRWKVTGVAIED